MNVELNKFMKWGAQRQGFPYGEISYWMAKYKAEQALGDPVASEEFRRYYGVTPEWEKKAP